MKDEHKDRTREMIKVMQAYVDGQPLEIYMSTVGWCDAAPPFWNWSSYNYRIAQKPDYIDWSHVAPEWKYMARDLNGHCFIFDEKPRRSGQFWATGEGRCISAKGFTSFKQGTVGWEDSLVVRPNP